MADITGNYDLYEQNVDSKRFLLFGRDNSNTLYLRVDGRAPTEMNFQDSSGSLFFTFQPLAIHLLFDFYTGKLQLDSQGNPLAFFGTHHSYQFFNHTSSVTPWFAVYSGPIIG